jgi:hypothetical protein
MIVRRYEIAQATAPPLTTQVRRKPRPLATKTPPLATPCVVARRMLVHRVRHDNHHVDDGDRRDAR